MWRWPRCTSRPLWRHCRTRRPPVRQDPRKRCCCLCSVEGKPMRQGPRVGKVGRQVWQAYHACTCTPVHADTPHSHTRLLTRHSCCNELGGSHLRPLVPTRRLSQISQPKTAHDRRDTQSPWRVRCPCLTHAGGVRRNSMPQPPPLPKQLAD